MDFEAGLRRSPDPGPIPTESEPALVERIRTEIVANGPMTFARFMHLAMYDPDFGYYRVADERPGRDGDFLTAPETHPIFGAAVARQLVEIWERLGQPDRFVLREYGAGSGTLALTVLEALAGRGRLGRVAGSAGLSAAIRYAPIEINPYRLATLTERIGTAGFGSHLAADLPPGEPVVGAVLANEFLDALPVHRVRQRGDHLQELFVAWDGTGFVPHAGRPSTPDLQGRLAADGVRLGDGARAEICLALDGWVAELAAGLERGGVLIIDYGHPAAELYGPARAGGTLMAYSGHQAHDDWSVAVGRQDLTAHVDFSALERSAAANGLTPLGLTSQAEFLVGVGTDELLGAIRSDPGTTMEEWLAVRSSMGRLLDPRAMGGFRVCLIGRGIPADPPLAGLGYHLPR
jgi:SAM-dependent MidA family methyltransferase